MDSEQRAINDWLVEYLRPGRTGTGETIGGPMDALLHSPKLAEMVGRMVPLIFEGLTVSRKATELAVLVTARYWNCNYEFGVHRRHAATFGLDLSIVDAIEVGIRPELDDQLEAVFKFVTQLLQDGDVSDGVFDTVVNIWGLQGTVELISTVGFYTMLAFVLNVDRCPVPNGGRILPPITAME
jgi:4-carboxymuconolactone decarboxylase